MPISVKRKGAWFAGAVAVLVVMVLAALPIIASTRIVRDGIAYQMSAWTGYRVQLDDGPAVHVWPTFGAVLNEVTLLDWDETAPSTVLHAERIEVELSALAALRGEVVFTEMLLVRPVLQLAEEQGRLHLPPPQSWGRIARSVDTARQAVSAEPKQPDTSLLPSETLGTVSFEDGRVVMPDGEQQADVIEGLTGTFEWPALNRQATLSASGVWRGESVSLTASSTQPLILLGGGNAPLSFSLKAAPAEATFNGTANLSGANFIDGQLTASTPSIDQLSEWVHAIALPTSDVGPVEFSARVIGNAGRLKFEQATLDLETSTGTGLLDISFAQGNPMVAGTLAFDRLDLRSLAETFSPFSSGPLAASGPSDAERLFDFDLRFSAANATFGQAALTDIAAAAKARNGLATFDISDATAFGGTIQLSLRADRTGESHNVELRTVGEEIDAAQLSTMLGQESLVPRAPMAFSLSLKGTGADLESVLHNMQGTASVTFGSGSVPGLSLDAFFQQSAAGDFFPLASISEGVLQIEGAELKATIASGIAQLENAEARTGQYVVSLDGIIPFAGRALALYGTLSAPEGADPRLDTPLMFFVGGSWEAPFVASFRRPERNE